MTITFLNHSAQIIDEILELMAKADVLSLAVALFINWKVGEYAIRESVALRRTGLGIGLVSFMAFLIRIWITSGMQTGGQLASASVRALLFSGFATAWGYMLLAVISFCWKHSFSSARSILEHR